MSATPCTHRPCQHSPDSREKCDSTHCCYAHIDHLLVLNYDGGKLTVEDYVILPGNLRGYMFVGEVPRGNIDSSTLKDLVYDEIKER